MNRADKARRHRDRELYTNQLLCASLVTVNGILLGTGGAVAVSVASCYRIIFFSVLAIASLSGMVLMIHAIHCFVMIERNNAVYFEWADAHNKEKYKDENTRKNEIRIEYESNRNRTIKTELTLTIWTIIITSICMIVLVIIN